MRLRPLVVLDLLFRVWSSAIVDTGQVQCYSATVQIECPRQGEAYYGQDASYLTIKPKYRSNGDATITDMNTGLTWTQARQDKMSLAAARKAASSTTIGGFQDWKLPTVTQLYSLINFTGITPLKTLEERSPQQYISELFDWSWGRGDKTERLIDVQYLSNTEYVSTTFNGDATVFGVNFGDGRIKGYPSKNEFYSLFVRGTSSYGTHSFTRDGDTVIDVSSGLMWMRSDSGKLGMDWPTALDYCDSLQLAGYNDWRLPDAKELQALVDYDRSPDTTNSAAIHPIFRSTSFTNEGGAKDWPYYWTSTTHLDGLNLGEAAAYICFGRCLGYVNGKYLDVHGAGSQRSDPKIGNPPDPTLSFAPQGDVIRINNAVRCVRAGEVSALANFGYPSSESTIDEKMSELSPEIEEEQVPLPLASTMINETKIEMSSTEKNAIPNAQEPQANATATDVTAKAKYSSTSNSKEEHTTEPALTSIVNKTAAVVSTLVTSIASEYEKSENVKAQKKAKSSWSCSLLGLCEEVGAESVLRVLGTSGCPPYQEAWLPRQYETFSSLPPPPQVHGYVLRLPSQARRSERIGLPKALDPSSNTKTVVGIGLDGVLIQRATRPLRRGAEKLDLCGGFRTQSGAYAYRGVPLCLLRMLNDTTPKNWASVNAAADSAYSQHFLWPKTAPPSPQIGWAMDGAKIYGPYNSAGKLINGDSLDACNAHFDTDQTEFSYHLTPDFPYIIGCFHGQRGTVYSTYTPVAEATLDCPQPSMTSSATLSAASAACALDESCRVVSILDAKNAPKIVNALQNSTLSVWPIAANPTQVAFLATRSTNAAIIAASV